MHSVLPVILALLAALLAAVGTVMRQQSTRTSGAVERGWYVGAAVAVVAFLLQVAALTVGTVLLVQPLIALSVLFEVFVQAGWRRRWPPPRQWIQALAVAVGVLLFIAFARPVPARHGRQTWVLDVVVFGLLLVLAVATVIARRSTGTRSGLLYGAVAGSLFGLVAVQINSLAEPFHGLAATLTNPTFYICLITVALAIVAQQRAFGRAALEASYPAMVASEPLVAMALSLAILGEKLSSHQLSTYVAVAGLALMLIGIIGLARSTAIEQEHESRV